MGKVLKAETVKKVSSNGADLNGAVAKAERLSVLKTYKIYIDGKFPRTESGRYYIINGLDGKPLANVCHSSRKDFREAVVAARKAFSGWAGKSAYNRGQILYRIAEMMEGRKAQLVSELTQQGVSASDAEAEVLCAIDRLVYYSGWTDKYQQVFSAVNPVESSHFNFSVPEPSGVVTILASEEHSLLGLVSVVAPAIAGGNTCVALASASKPLCSVTFSEILHSSDVPGGVVNILTGHRKELVGHFSSHMDVNSLVYCGTDAEELKSIQINAALNVKRVIVHKTENWLSSDCQSPYFIMDTQEIKTTWHPIGV
jgi:acyl-CoA reductase-like NAD-dependent aldehyde dehydrogenase